MAILFFGVSLCIGWLLIRLTHRTVRAHSIMGRALALHKEIQLTKRKLGELSNQHKEAVRALDEEQLLTYSEAARLINYRLHRRPNATDR